MRVAPPGLLLRNVKIAKGPTQFSQLLLVGIERANIDHSIHVRELLTQLRPSAVLTAVEPDLPVLLAAKSDYEVEYCRFVAEGSASARFFVRPDPVTPTHVTLTPDNLTRLVKQNFNQGRYRCANIFVTESDPHNDKEEVNGLLTALLWSEQNRDSSTSVLLAGFPYLTWLDITARTLLADEFARLLSTLGERSKALAKLRATLDANFARVNDIRCLYMTELAFQASGSYAKMVFVVEAHLVDLVHRCMRGFSEQKAIGLRNLLNARITTRYQVDFHQYMRKLVYLDCAGKHVMERYFRAAGRFPFPVDARVAGAQHSVNFYEQLWDAYLAEAHRALGPLFRAALPDRAL